MSASEGQDLSKLKVVELKDLLKQAGLAVSGKKDDLIQRLSDHQQEHLSGADIPNPASPSPDGVPNTASPTQPVAEAQPAAKLDSQARNEPIAGSSPQEEGQTSTSVKVLKSASTNTRTPERAEVVGTDTRDPKRFKMTNGAELSQVIPPASHKAEAEADEHKSTTLDYKFEEVEQSDHEFEYDYEPEDDVSSRPTDLYLDTINRHALDFDFERLCSVTLSQNNIYACLTDGKYFQGRGKTSPAYAHCIAEDHHVYINLTTQKVYILPDGYEVIDHSLDDIKYLLFPTFTPTLLKRIDAAQNPSYDLAQTPYYPGFVGLNNIKSNSYMNAILHALVHVIPLRDYFILDPLASSTETTELVRRFSMLCRKIWNPRAFKAQVSPHELLQECANASAKRFKITEAGDPLEFLGWLLNTLHRDLGGNKKPKSSIIYSAFQGEVRVDDQQVLTTGEYGGKPRFDLDRDIKSTRSPFLFLAIDLPPPPVFQDTVAANIIPQVPISAVLAKYDGKTTQEAKGIIRRWKITRLPPFLILHIKRFTKNNFVEEKNQTIVNFPLRGVDMSEYVESSESISEFYDLVSNITHSSAAGTAREETTWKNDDDEKWFEIQDLIVDEIQQQLISLGESYIQIWERRGAAGQLAVHRPQPKPPKTRTAAI